jgi:Uma2 family endonuclease
VTLREYLHTSFENPDPEYVRGQIVERGTPGLSHGWAQTRLIQIFYEARERVALLPLPSVRHRLSECLVRVPDIAVRYPEECPEQVPSSPPLVAVEITSPDDRFSNLMAKLSEYEAFCVPHIWVIDPQIRHVAIYRDDSLRFVTTLDLPEHDIAIRFEDLTR